MALPQSAYPAQRLLHWSSATLALLAAAFFRTQPLLDNRFHPDEALYAAFGRLIASGQEVLLSNLVVDKPPLAFYLTALSFLLFGQNELAARLPALLASLISVGLLFALARRLYGLAAAHLAAWILALSPFAILFAITVFIDPLLTALGLWGLWLVTLSRPRLAALAFALAFATKQTALIFIPLALGFGLLGLPAGASLADAGRALARIGRPLVIGLVAVAVIVAAWDAARQPPIGLWEQGASDNLPGRFIRSGEVVPRARAWLDLLYHVTASPPANLALSLGLPVLLAGGLRRASRAALADLILAGYVLLYLAAYWLLAFNVWDRYLVPIVPLIALLLARVAAGAGLLAGRLPALWRPTRRVGVVSALGLAFVLLLTPPAFTAARSGYAIGGDHGAYDGIDEAALFVRSLPAGGVLYDHWLSWEWNFYLFDRPLYVAWFPAPAALAADLQAFGRTSPRYLVVPSWEADAEVRAAAARAGFAFVRLHGTARRDGSTSFVIYALRPVDP